MDLLSALEKIGQAYTIERLTKRVEPHDKKRSVLTGEEVFNLDYERYQTIKEILMPLEEKLGENVQIIDFRFAKGMQEDTMMDIIYLEDGKTKILSICKSDLACAEMGLPEDDLKRSFIRSYKKTIDGIFKQIRESFLDSEYSIPSTSGSFIVGAGASQMRVSYRKENILSIKGNYITYEKKGLMYLPTDCYSSVKGISRILQSDENVRAIYRNLRVYEEDVPKRLIKS